MAAAECIMKNLMASRIRRVPLHGSTCGVDFLVDRLPPYAGLTLSHRFLRDGWRSLGGIEMWVRSVGLVEQILVSLTRNRCAVDGYGGRSPVSITVVSYSRKPRETGRSTLHCHGCYHRREIFVPGEDEGFSCRAAQGSLVVVYDERKVLRFADSGDRDRS